MNLKVKQNSTPGSQPQIVVLMGVSGCGKTSVGQRISQELSWPFYDGDDFHPQENIKKMAAGIPLNDDDRTPWLANLHDLITKHQADGKSMLLACSALKQIYRDQLAEGNSGMVFVYLKGDFELILGRMYARAGHYMKTELLQSQFEALEEPAEALVIDIRQNLDTITEEIVTQLRLRVD